LQTLVQKESSEQIWKSNTAVAKLFSDSVAGLKLVEDRIRLSLTSDAALLTEISNYLLELGGKRIRPILALSTARLFGMVDANSELIDASAGIELIHMATLLHDDIIDDSAVRRHKVSPFRKYGLAPSLLAGDFLLARAFGLCSHLDIFIIEHTEKACVELTEGELLEGVIDAPVGKTFADYLTVIEKKTASLFLLASAVGSHVSGANADSVERLTNFGRLAGVAFQMVDDILDVVADEDLLGKPTGTDLKQKTPSLVNCLWLDSGDKAAAEFFAKPSPTPEEALTAAKYLRDTKVISESQQIAKKYTAMAKEQLENINDPLLVTSVRDDLFALLDFTLARSLT
jgi:geranylgeranyl pyrophosphate synthase